MNKRNLIILTLILSLSFTNKVYADCTNEIRNEFSNLKTKYKITTEFNTESKKYDVTIEKGNSSNFKYITSITTTHECEEISDTVTKCYDLDPGFSFYAYVIGNTDNCNEMLRNERIKLPKLNEFYGDPLCKGIEEFVLCQEIYEREIDRETFEKRIESYKNKKEELKKEEEKIEQAKENNFKKSIEYLKENIIQIILIFVLIVLLTITSIIAYKKIKKSRRLE